MQEYYAHGKLLLSAEYTVLQGAQALAFPTRQGQRLIAVPHEKEGIHWQSFDLHGNCWFSVVFDDAYAVMRTEDPAKADFLQRLFKNARKLGGKEIKQVQLSSYLEFDASWGLGSSSSLIALVAQLFEVDALTLFFKSTRGSGYDVACAQASSPILYHLKEPQKAFWEKTSLPAPFYEALFVHLNQKQRSLPEVNRFLQQAKDAELIKTISALTRAFLSVSTIGALQELIEEHEALTSRAVGLPTVKSSLFTDFRGSIKSLGAWGGDFVMALGEEGTSYFSRRGYSTVLRLSDLLYMESPSP